MPINTALYVENFSEALLQLDSEGYIVYANPAITRLTGFPEAELLNRRLSVFYANPDDSYKVDYDLDQARQNGKMLTEGWRLRKDGTRFWAQVHLSSLSNPGGDIYGYSCLILDLSSKKEGEMELRKREERYRLMVDRVQEYSIFMLDPQGNILSWNDGARRITGYHAQEIIGKHFSIFYTGNDIQEDKPARELDTAIMEGKYKEEGWRIRKDGFVFWADVVLTPLFNDRNKLIGFSKVTRDLTERKENEEHLRASEERYRMFVEQVRDYAIFMMDEKGQIATWNDGARRIKGYEAGEIIGKYFSIFYTEEDILDGKPARELQIAQATGKYEEEGWRIRKDGSRFWALVVITAVLNAAGNLVGYSKVTRDLTERKASERALRESFERYRTLAGELKIINSELSYANQELEQFTSIVSHDLQEPLRTTKSFLQIIEKKLATASPEELGTYLKKANLATDRMRELIHNLLHYSRLAKEDINEERVEVRELFTQALQNLKGVIDDRNVQYSMATEVEYVEGDRVQLVQLIQNLVSNAIKFTRADPPRVQLRCSEENGAVKMSVTDNGIGIAEEDYTSVFEIFRRLNTRYAGTGIGLSICKKIVERHHGRIWPESVPGEGTTFHFTLNDASID